MHPKQQEAMQKSEAVALEKQRVKDETAHLVGKHGLKFQHIRARDEKGNAKARGGVTLAWRPYGPPKSRKRLIEVSNTICSDKDVYCKATGRYTAAKAFAADRCIIMQVPREGTISMFLDLTFAGQLFDNVSDLMNL